MHAPRGGRGAGAGDSDDDGDDHAEAGAGSGDDEALGDGEIDDDDIIGVFKKLWSDWRPFAPVSREELAPYLASVLADSRYQALIAAYALTPKQVRGVVSLLVRALTVRAVRADARKQLRKEAAALHTARSRAEVERSHRAWQYALHERTAVGPITVDGARALQAPLHELDWQRFRFDVEQQLRTEMPSLLVDVTQAALLGAVRLDRSALVAPTRAEFAPFWRPAGRVPPHVAAMKRAAAATVNAAVAAYGYWADEKTIFVGTVHTALQATIPLIRRPALPREAFI
jgi:hypothetical protein